MLTFAFYNTITGEPEFGPVRPQSSTWLARLESGGRVDVVLNFRDLLNQIPQPILHDLSDPTGKYSIAVSDPGGVLAAGVIMDSPLDDDSSTLTISGEDIGDVFWDARLGSGVNSIKDAGLEFENESASGAVRRILFRAMAENEYAAWRLPVDLPDDAPGTFDMKVRWYELRHMGELLDEIRQRGYRIHHRPYLMSEGFLRYSTQVAKRIIGSEWVIPYGADESPLSGLKYRRNGQDMITGVVYAGNGEGSKMKIRWAGAASVTSPIRDRADTSTKSVKNTRALQAAADADIEEHSRPTVVFSYLLTRTDDFELSDFVPGTMISLDIRGHEVIPDGLWRTTVTALSGDVHGVTATPEVELVERLP